MRQVTKNIVYVYRFDWIKSGKHQIRAFYLAISEVAFYVLVLEVLVILKLPKLMMGTEQRSSVKVVSVLNS